MRSPAAAAALAAIAFGQCTPKRPTGGHSAPRPAGVGGLSLQNLIIFGPAYCYSLTVLLLYCTDRSTAVSVTCKGASVALLVACLQRPGMIICSLLKYEYSSTPFRAVGFGIHVYVPYVRTTLACLLYTSPSPRDRQKSRMPSSA